MKINLKSITVPYNYKKRIFQIPQNTASKLIFIFEDSIECEEAGEVCRLIACWISGFAADSYEILFNEDLITSSMEVEATTEDNSPITISLSDLSNTILIKTKENPIGYEISIENFKKIEVLNKFVAEIAYINEGSSHKLYDDLELIPFEEDNLHQSSVIYNFSYLNPDKHFKVDGKEYKYFGRPVGNLRANLTKIKVGNNSLNCTTGITYILAKELQKFIKAKEYLYKLFVEGKVENISLIDGKAFGCEFTVTDNNNTKANPVIVSLGVDANKTYYAAISKLNIETNEVESISDINVVSQFFKNTDCAKALKEKVIKEVSFGNLILILEGYEEITNKLQSAVFSPTLEMLNSFISVFHSESEIEFYKEDKDAVKEMLNDNTLRIH